MIGSSQQQLSLGTVSPSMVAQVSQSMQDMNGLGLYSQNNNNTMLSSHISSLMADPSIFSGHRSQGDSLLKFDNHWRHLYHILIHCTFFFVLPKAVQFGIIFGDHVEVLVDHPDTSNDHFLKCYDLFKNILFNGFLFPTVGLSRNY
jgi:hypothetical protein